MTIREDRMAPHGATFLAATRSHPISIRSFQNFIPVAVRGSPTGASRQTWRGVVKGCGLGSFRSPAAPQPRSAPCYARRLHATSPSAAIPVAISRYVDGSGTTWICPRISPPGNCTVWKLR